MALLAAILEISVPCDTRDKVPLISYVRSGYWILNALQKTGHAPDKNAIVPTSAHFIGAVSDALSNDAHFILELVERLNEPRAPLAVNRSPVSVGVDQPVWVLLSAVG